MQVDNVSASLVNVTVDGFTTATAQNVCSVLIPIQHPTYEAHFVGISVGYKFYRGVLILTRHVA